MELIASAARGGPHQLACFHLAEPPAMAAATITDSMNNSAIGPFASKAMQSPEVIKTELVNPRLEVALWISNISMAYIVQPRVSSRSVSPSVDFWITTGHSRKKSAAKDPWRQFPSLCPARSNRSPVIIVATSAGILTAISFTGAPEMLDTATVSQG